MLDAVSAHFAEFATLVRLNSPPVSRVFAASSEAAAAADARASIHPLILTSFELVLSA